jgi:hypothetical protein
VDDRRGHRALLDPGFPFVVFGSYNATTYNGTAKTLFCSSPQSPIRTLGGVAPTGAVAFAGCNPDFTCGTWVRARSGTRCRTSMSASRSCTPSSSRTTIRRSVAFNFAGAGGRAVGLYAPSNQDIFTGLFRIQRNFWP